MSTVTVRRKDFLRHIVNRILASPDAPKQIVDDLRRAVGQAEDKYKFHAFGGDVRRLADYLRSRDFDDLIMIAKSDRSGKGLEVLKRILEEAKKAYSDIPEVVQAIEERLKQLREEGVEAAARKKPLERLAESLEELTKLGASVKYESGQDVLEVKLGEKVDAKVTYDSKNKVYMVDVSVHDRRDFERIDLLREYLRSLIELFR